MRSEKKLKCLFCKWLDRTTQEHQDLIKENRVLNPNTFEDDEGYLAVLDRDPKVTGHTLIISTKVDPKHDQEHYKDITELKIKDITEQSDNVIEHLDEIRFFGGVVKWAHRIKDKINKEFGDEYEKVKKVYILSMCDHWTTKELGERWQDATEHLHFHLVPRYDFDENIRGEEVLIRGTELKSEELKSKKLNPKNQREIEEIYEILKEQKE